MCEILVKAIDATNKDKDKDRMSDVDIAWLAGFLEGEGCFGIIGPPKDKISGFVRIQATNTDLDVLEKCVEITRLGTIYACSKRDQYKQCYIWRIANQRDALEIMKLVYAHMGDRRKAQIEKSIAYYEKKEREGRTTRLTHRAFDEEKNMLQWANDSRCVIGLATLKGRYYMLKWPLEKALTVPKWGRL